MAKSTTKNVQAYCMCTINDTYKLPFDTIREVPDWAYDATGKTVLFQLNNVTFEQKPEIDYYLKPELFEFIKNKTKVTSIEAISQDGDIVFKSKDYTELQYVMFGYSASNKGWILSFAFI